MRVFLAYELILIEIRLQLFVGVAVFVIPRIPDTWKATYLKMHVVFGPAILILSSCSAILGVYDIGKKMYVL